MKNVLKKFSDTDIRFNCRFSYPHVFEPETMPSGGKKFGCCLLIDKNDTQTVKALQDAINAAKELGKTSKWGNKIPGNLKGILRDGDGERPDDPNYAGQYFINANSNTKPGVKILENGLLADALDEGDFYAGCFGAAEVNFYPYDQGGSRGISAGLNNLIKLEDGERLAGGRSADDAFSDLA
jgi:hypothetical protein